VRYSLRLSCGALAHYRLSYVQVLRVVEV